MAKHIDLSLLRTVAENHADKIAEPFRSMAVSENGFDAVFAFLEATAGTTIYVPSMRTIFLRCLELEAAQEFDGHNARHLCRKYDFSDRHIRKVIANLV